MQYVSIRFSALARRFLIVLACLFANSAQPALGNEEPLPGNTQEPTNQSEIERYLFSDEQIAELCKASIASHYDMVKVKGDDGQSRVIPRCVLIHENMRAVARQYTDAKVAEAEKVKAAPAGCNEDPSQKNCIEGFTALGVTLRDLHETMITKADQAKEQLDLIAASAPQKPGVGQ